MKKKGSHVGMVLSFVIFITFLVFLYSIVEPAIKTQKDEQAVLEYLKTELIGKVSADLTSVSIAIDKTTNKDCVELENLRTETGIDSKLIVKDNLENSFTAKISDDDLFIDRESSEDDFFKIRVSEEFEETETGTMSDCEILQEGSISGYTIGLIRTNKYVFEAKIIELKEEYENDYENLKDELGVSSGNEFGFSFSYNNGTTIGTEESVSTNIYTEEIPIQYIDESASILSGSINIKIW